jgi:outer membrane protein TolC
MRIKIFLLMMSVSCVMKAYPQDSLTLFQAVKMGLEKNYSIIIQKNNAQIASNNNTAGNAGFLPDVTLSATQNNTITTTHQEMFNGDVKDINNAHNSTLNAGVLLTWTLFDGFSMFTNKSTLNVLEQMGDTEARLTIENTVSAIINNYYGIIQQQKMIQVLRDAVGLSLQRKQIAEAKLALGSGSQLTLLQSTVDLNSDSTDLLREMASLQGIKADLNRLLGRDPEIACHVVDTIILNNDLSYGTLLEKARSQNAELRIADQNKELSLLSLKNARSQRYPSLTFQAGYNYNKLNSQTGFLQFNRSLGPSYGVTASYPIFNGFNISREIRNATIELSNSENQFLDTELDVHNNLFKLYIAYTSNIQVVRLQTVNQDVARENVNVAFEKYRLGAISDIDLRETQKKFIDAQYQLLLSQFQSKQAEVELLRISGELVKLLGF